MQNSRPIGFFSASSIVIANMIGTGVFTTLGFQVLEIDSVPAILMLWIIGGMMALCGALVYGEIGVRLPRSGGEYFYLSKIYHPAIGFLAGWTSLFAGFAAPVALAAMALGQYFAKTNLIPGIDPRFTGIAVVVLFSLIHSYTLHYGKKVQNVFTVLKVGLIIFFIISGLTAPSPVTLSLLPDAHCWSWIFHPVFAVSLVYVSFAYSGWNASAYIAGEIERPEKNLPMSLLAGTVVVILLYVMLNFIFLYTVPASELAGQIEVGQISAGKIFGEGGGRIMSAMISLLLVSTVSSMIIAGPRVTQVMGEDTPVMNIFSVKNRHGVPARALLLQSGITLFFILTSTFEQVLTYTGFTLNLFTFLTVAGIFLIRKKPGDSFSGYRTRWYPLTPILFLLINLWILIFVFINKPWESLFGIVTVLLGLVVYYSGKKSEPRNGNS
ncbi:MAG: amino acid permease [Bacteroidetes bacterium]|nr:amino acid permease [Bacteroidota bacterium]